MEKLLQIRVQGDADAVAAALRLLPMLPPGLVHNIGVRRNANGSMRAYGLMTIVVGDKPAKAQPTIDGVLESHS